MANTVDTVELCVSKAREVARFYERVFGTKEREEMSVHSGPVVILGLGASPSPGDRRRIGISSVRTTCLEWRSK